jgi:hypothetical protein
MASLAAWVFAVCAALTVLSVGRVQAAYGSPAGAVVFVLGVALLIAAVVASRWAHWTTPGFLEAGGSGKDQGHGNDEEVPGRGPGAGRGDGR